MEKITITKSEYEALQALKTDNTRLEKQVNYLLEQMRLSRHKQFGASSEKSEYDSEQLNLFNEAEAFETVEDTEPELKEIEKHYRKKRKELPSKLPEDLPVETVEHRLSESEQNCPNCDEQMHVMGKEVVRRELKLIPAKAIIVEHVQYTYSCRNCEKNDIETPIVKASLPTPVIPNSFVSAEAIAHVVHQKFVMGVPLYRQEQEWKRQGIELSRQTMSNWLIKSTENRLMPFYEAMKTRLVNSSVLHADETTLQVLNEPGKSAQSKSYMWLYRTSGDVKHATVVYEYQPNRKMEHPKAFLQNFSGYLHTDGYSGYHSLPPNIVVVGCFAHARRKFDEALKILPEKERKTALAYIGKTYCDRLFELERRFADLSFEDRLAKRQELAKPVLDEFLLWLQKQITGKSALGKAVNYTLEQWKYLIRYMLDGRLEISNNRAERAIKPFVIGRKNFLFCNVVKGAQSSAVLYSIVETAKVNGLNPYEYLSFLLRSLSNDPSVDIESLLPGSKSIPASCYSPKAKMQDLPWDECLV